jgi:hypothetical protein
MWSISRHRVADVITEPVKPNPLVRVVRPFDQRTRHALYAAANSGALRRRTWNGCAFNRAAALLGVEVASQAHAAQLFRVRRQLIGDFICAWDNMRDSDAKRTEILRDAILEVGLFPPSPAPPARSAAGSTSSARKEDHDIRAALVPWLG